MKIKDICEGQVVPFSKKKTDKEKFSAAVDKQNTPKFRKGAGETACKYCGDKNCDFDCEASQDHGAQDLAESTTSGSIAPVSMPMNGGKTNKRPEVGKGVYGNVKAGSLMKGKQTSKKFANSISEGKKPSKVDEADLKEDDIIIKADPKNIRKTGLVKQGQRYKDDLAMVHDIAKNAASLYEFMAKRPGNFKLSTWAQDILTKTNSLLKTVCDDMIKKEGVMGAALGAAAGAAITKTPAGATTGAKLGSAVQDMVSEKKNKDKK